MKELSIEEKAKRYDEAIERAKKWRNAPNIDKMPTYGNRIIEELFPELKESEDERIRKGICKYIYNKRHNIEQLNPYTDEFDRWIAWLEKQGEQKTNKCMYSKDNYTDEDRRILCDGCEEDCKYAQKEEPVSEELEEAAKEHAVERFRTTRDEFLAEKCKWSFKAGAQWQKEQMMQGAVDATITDIRTYKEKNEVDFTITLEKGIIPYEVEQKVKITSISMSTKR